MNTCVYLDSETCRWQLDQTRASVGRFTDINQFINNTGKKKIAIFHIPYPYNMEFEQRVELILDTCDSIIILCSELHEQTVDFIIRYDHPKLNYFICGFLNWTPTHSQINQWLDWFITTSYVYKHNTILDQLTPFQQKDKYFDILLGQPKLHRSFIYNKIINLKLTNQVVMTYLQDFNKTLQQQDTTGWQWEMPGLNLPNLEFKWTVTPVKYYGHNMSLSQVIPFDIYNQTAYSIVAETKFDNYYTFYTEKTVKPILAKRLFIVFAGQYHLSNLRKLGFKTFNGIIDESYDNVEDQTLRFNLAMEQVQYLICQPQDQIFREIESIVLHNQKLMLSTNWMECLNKEFNKLI